MKFRFSARNLINRVPKTPGVYAFKKGRQILYIGKAMNLRERVKNHLQQPGFRAELFVNQAKKVGYIKTGSDIEALILEAKLIKKYKPRYNVVWRDDKNYFFVGITREDFPTVFITHQAKKSKGQESKIKIDYIGPFVEGRALKQTLDVLRRIFPYRTCKPYSGKPCLWYQLGRCPGPCLLGSKLAKELPGLEKTIKKESQRNIKNLKKFLEGRKTQVLKGLRKDMKTSSKIRDFEKAAKIRDQIFALERVLEHGRIFDWIEPETLRGRRSPSSSTWEKIEKHLKKLLKIRMRVKRIEAYDVSNIQGQNATGSMVTFVRGRPDKNFYRRFKIRIEQKPNDVAMIKEILTRRFAHPEWGRPDLILIDGGKPQLSAAINSKLSIPNYKKIKIIALAKEKNELFIEGQKEPVLLKSMPREIFNLILQLRDEAHRFAIAYHRKLREKF
jgi:excinuclease ABC subunit C